MWFILQRKTFIAYLKVDDAENSHAQRIPINDKRNFTLATGEAISRSLKLEIFGSDAQRNWRKQTVR